MKLNKVLNFISEVFKTLPFLFAGIFTTIITASLFIHHQFGLNSILGVIDVYLKIILTSWPATILIIGLFLLIQHRLDIGYFIRERMTEAGPNGFKGEIKTSEQSDTERKRKTIQESRELDIEFEAGVPRRNKPNTDKEETLNRYKKIIEIEEIVNTQLLSKYGNKYQPHMRLTNSITAPLLLDGILTTTKRKIAIEIKYISSKSFTALKWIIAKKLRRLGEFGIKRLYVVVVSDNITEDDAESMYLENIHQANLFFYSWSNSNLNSITPKSTKDILF